MGDNKDAYWTPLIDQNSTIDARRLPTKGAVRLVQSYHTTTNTNPVRDGMPLIRELIPARTISRHRDALVATPGKMRLGFSSALPP